jgi:tRNA(His) 5'-end guanylyltransferase
MVRIDGRNFSKIFSDFEKPYDERFARAMVESAVAVMKEFNAMLCYIFSDEANFYFKHEIFGRRVEKINSVIASIFSSNLSLRLDRHVSFDSRIIHVTDDFLVDYLSARQRECWRNHLNAYAFYRMLEETGDRKEAQRRLKGMRSAALHDFLFEKGINPARTPAWQRRGILIHWVQEERRKIYQGKEVTFTRRVLKQNWEPPLFWTEEGKDYLSAVAGVMVE